MSESVPHEPERCPDCLGGKKHATDCPEKGTAMANFVPDGDVRTTYVLMWSKCCNVVPLNCATCNSTGVRP